MELDGCYCFEGLVAEVSHRKQKVVELGPRMRSCTKSSNEMIPCTMKGKPLVLLWGRTPRLDSDVRVSQILGFPNISLIFVSGPKWDPRQGKIRNSRVLADLGFPCRLLLVLWKRPMEALCPSCCLRTITSWSGLSFSPLCFAIALLGLGPYNLLSPGPKACYTYYTSSSPPSLVCLLHAMLLHAVEMDLLSFIQTANLTKVRNVRVGERQRTEDEPRLLDITVGRVVPLLPIDLARAESELDASVDKLFDEGSNGNQAEQGDSASGGHGVGIQLVSEAVETVVEDAAPVQPRCQRKRNKIVSDAGGPSHPPKKLREDHGTLSGASIGGKSRSTVQRLLAGVVQNAKVRGEPIPTLPFVMSSVSATPECEDEAHTDSATELNLRTIGAPPRFVISSNYSHHSGANIAEAEVDSFARPSVPLMTVATTVYFQLQLTATKPLAFLTYLAVTSIVGDDDHTCHEMVDEFAPPKFFESIHGMEHDQLFTEFNVGAARQMSLSAEVRMRAEYNVRERRRLNVVVREKNSLLKARDEELESLKTQCMNWRLLLLEGLPRERYGVWSVLLPLESSNEKIKKVNEKFDKLCADFVEMALHIKEKFYPRLLTPISERRWTAIGKADEQALRDVFVPLSEPLSAVALEGREGTSVVLLAHLANYDSYNEIENDDLRYHSEEYFDDAHEDDENNHSNGNVVKRGITRLYKFRMEYGKPGGVKLSVTFDALNRISGKHKALFSSFLGDMVREHIGLKILAWNKVGSEARDKLWDEITRYFDVDLTARKLVMNRLGQLLRNFRTKLRRTYILPNQDTPSKLNEVPAKYTAILKAEEWVNFVKYTATQAYKVKSAAEIEPDEEPSRGTLWLKGRVNKDGDYPDDEIRSVGDKLKETEDKIKEGTLKVDQGTDAITVVLGKEKGGYARGVGSGVTYKRYFDLPRSKQAADERILLLQSQLDAARRERQEKELLIHSMSCKMSQTEGLVTKLKTQLAAKGGQLQSMPTQLTPPAVSLVDIHPVNNNADEEGGTTVETVKSVGAKKTTRSIRKDSLSQDSQSKENVSVLQQAIKCRLWHLKKSTIIAEGTVYKSDGKIMLPNKALPKDFYKVSIDKSLVDAAFIPDVENNGCTKVLDAVGGFVVWPKNQVVLDPKATPPSTIQMITDENKTAPKVQTKRKNVYVSSDAMQKEAKIRINQKALVY
ncbi:hypothetical protein Tco_0938491 [Tanacetum coccineum]|uniref:DUF8039 domain-containing protein n=1 Tax=Tanacetum coccineum TaxID=301880 RepID=A0ABQ5DK08_9ASTR